MGKGYMILFGMVAPYSSSPRRRGSSVVRDKTLGSRLRGNDDRTTDYQRAARVASLMPVGDLIDPLEHRDQFGTLGVAGLVQGLRRSMQELVGEAASEKLQHLLRRSAGDEKLARAFE